MGGAEWAVLKGAGGAGSARDEPATPTGYIPVAALGPDVHIIIHKSFKKRPVVNHNNFNDIFWTYIQNSLKPSTASGVRGPSAKQLKESQQKTWASNSNSKPNVTKGPHPRI